MQIDFLGSAKRNILLGICNRIIILICPFIERSFVNSILGTEYLGLGSLFQSILSVLSLAELGFGSAMVYNMYKPVAEGDTDRVNALLNYYRKVYRIIGIGVAIIGVVIIPLLPQLIKGSYPSDIRLVPLYLIFVLNASLSYFLYAYMTAIVVVSQREDLRSTVDSGIKILLTISEVIVLYFTHNFYLFALLLPVFTVTNNLWLAWRVKKLFPFYTASGEISDSDRRDIKKLVAGTFIQQACALTRNSFDSICISAFIGLTMTAIYNNYYLIVKAVASFTAIYCAAFAGGIGNHVATKTVSENYEEMKTLDFVYLWVGGWSTVCLLCLYQPFMKIWMGDEMLLPLSSVILLCIYSYLLKLGDIRYAYSSARGLWWEQRFRALAETVLNLALNIIMGKLYGLNGIIIATMISLFLCNYLWSTDIVFKLYFTRERKKDYHIYQMRQSLLTLGVCVLVYITCCYIDLGSRILDLIIKTFICITIPNLIFWVTLKETPEFKKAYGYLKNKGVDF